MTFERKTVRSPIAIDGKGLHGGQDVRVVIHPSDSGLAFRAGTSRWEAVAENVTDTTRCTRLGEISTIEHLMSALAGLEVSDAEIEVEGGELPALDGSAAEYVREIAQAGLVDLGASEGQTPFKRVFHQEGEIKIAIGKGDGHWKYTYDLGDRWPGVQTSDVDHISDRYAVEVAPARTFALAEEIPMIVQMGLAKGLDQDKALILGIEGYKNDARFPDEPARHKLLDLMGDLYLAGIPIRFLNVAAERSGHASNVRAALLLRQSLAS
jgi:UDP-3-O-[3-hydroxymyristoyl] N-acetylglucosamine deacetylase